MSRLFKCCSSRENPYHPVTVPEFEIDITEVTIGQYRACVNDNESCSEPSGSSSCNWNHSDREEHPVNCITWHQAKTFCEWSDRRLCTESEWEKAARGTDGRIYPWGNEEADCERAVMNDHNSGCGENHTWPVASKPAGANNLYDMAGNVQEIVEDDYHENYEDAPSDGTAWIENPRTSQRVKKGGSYARTSSYMRASHRYSYRESEDSSNVGFRCCSDR